MSTKYTKHAKRKGPFHGAYLDGSNFRFAARDQSVDSDWLCEALNDITSACGKLYDALDGLWAVGAGGKLQEYATGQHQAVKGQPFTTDTAGLELAPLACEVMRRRLVQLLFAAVNGELETRNGDAVSLLERVNANLDTTQGVEVLWTPKADWGLAFNGRDARVFTPDLEVINPGRFGVFMPGVNAPPTTPRRGLVSTLRELARKLSPRPPTQSPDVANARR